MTAVKIFGRPVRENPALQQVEQRTAAAERSGIGGVGHRDACAAVRELFDSVHEQLQAGTGLAARRSPDRRAQDAAPLRAL